MSKAAELRKKIESERGNSDLLKNSTQERLLGTNERLRADHISMMELLNKTVNSNMQLESELANLRKILSGTSPTSLEAANTEISTLKKQIAELQTSNDISLREKESLQINCDEQIKVLIVVILIVL